MKNILLICIVGILGQFACSQQPVAKQTANFMVLGNCGMCKKTIEKAAKGAGAATANWNKDTDMMAVGFDDKTASLDAIQKAIAQAGYDNATYLADANAYNNLPDCCHYEHTGAAGGTKACQ